MEIGMMTFLKIPLLYTALSLIPVFKPRIICYQRQADFQFTHVLYAINRILDIVIFRLM